MGIIRAILSAIILFFDRVFAPKAQIRPPERQREIDVETKMLAVYQFPACPFCVKVRRHLTRRGLKIELRDVNSNSAFEKELVTSGGQLQVPCLRIGNSDGSVRWLYESADIIDYIDQRFAD